MRKEAKTRTTGQVQRAFSGSRSGGRGGPAVAVLYRIFGYKTIKLLNSKRLRALIPGPRSRTQMGAYHGREEAN